jgi:uncharacterized protein YndB with AHSA1/START domain
VGSDTCSCDLDAWRNLTDGEEVPVEAGFEDEGHLAYGFTIAQAMRAGPREVVVAWTEAFDTWFALPGAIAMNPVVGEPYWFDVVHEGERHAHYGRFTALEQARLIEQTWVTGKSGTDGAETLLRIELGATASGTLLRLTHRGFYDEEASKRHADAWPQVLQHLDEVLFAAN